MDIHQELAGKMKYDIFEHRDTRSVAQYPRRSDHSIEASHVWFNGVTQTRSSRCGYTWVRLDKLHQARGGNVWPDGGMSGQIRRREFC